MDPFSRLSAPRVLSLRIPYSAASATSATFATTIDAVETAAQDTRRAACARAAAARLNGGDSSDDLGSSDGEDEGEAAVLRVQTLPVAATIGGKVWDASLLLSAWILECSSGGGRHRFPPAGSRVLELGAGLGIVGLALAEALPAVAVTLSDYDPALLHNLEENIRLNAATTCSVAHVDFRDFERQAGAAVPPKYAEAGLCGYDMLIGSDIVYDSYHGQLASVCLALLAPSPPAAAAAEGGWRPCALFMLPDSRPRLREFVDELAAVGLECRIEAFDSECAMVHRLRRAHEGWGVDATFSLYFVSRALSPPAVSAGGPLPPPPPPGPPP